MAEDSSNSNTAPSGAAASSSTGDSGGASGPPKKKRMFSKELRAMMYGFGDDSSPYVETVELIEDLVVDFIGDVTQKSVSVGKRGTVRVEDLNYVIRNDVKKSARVRDLLMMNEELRRAKKKFEDYSY
ncbi:transcription initiation factor TFIID subunit 13-like [Sycon ciliatum]|uniref:transcription initiation factor TFIID subunit 13-like n=1 Tax=Sycon ciliatum TaxID=27933 RepID=UPI0031F6D11F|eukprot:scpid53395/ scgid34025/ Transcription initiation factor TFIID subunit 13; Transcription initiation factor TFIID 18 kDa subunit; Transcription initiation factor TFIID subunit 13; Transcription initiation factor TFIID 18 kDa subunit; Transcription initiation factor TFIID subunit 13; Transcription initiation factor TFIID 18 kDa subunit; Transcription initiation factor TFIID subunit 13; Transcription initiation factor TFIID 18 kDa subunit